jgi:hypothetical protein
MCRGRIGREHLSLRKRGVSIGAHEVTLLVPRREPRRSLVVSALLVMLGFEPVEGLFEPLNTGADR